MIREQALNHDPEQNKWALQELESQGSQCSLGLGHSEDEDGDGDDDYDAADDHDPS